MTQVLGLRELQANLKVIERELKEAEDPAAMAAGEPIAEAWRGLVPILDGNYRDSITVTWLSRIGKAGVGTAWLSSLADNEQPVLYATRFEYGDSEIAAQPSARPALKQAQAAAIDAAAVELRMRVKGRRRVKVT